VPNFFGKKNSQKNIKTTCKQTNKLVFALILCYGLSDAEKLTAPSGSKWALRKCQRII